MTQRGMLLFMGVSRSRGAMRGHETLSITRHPNLRATHNDMQASIGFSDRPGANSAWCKFDLTLSGPPTLTLMVDDSEEGCNGREQARTQCVVPRDVPHTRRCPLHPLQPHVPVAVPARDTRQLCGGGGAMRSANRAFPPVYSKRLPTAPSSAPNLIPQKVSIKSFCKIQFPHKSPNWFFVSGMMKDMLTDLRRNRLLQNEFIKNF